MLDAAIKHCPVFGGKLVELRRSQSREHAAVCAASSKWTIASVAVVADTWWRAKTALDALPIVWDEGEGAKASTATIAAHLKEGLTATDAFADSDEGDALKAIAAAPEESRGRLRHALPFARHAWSR